MRIEKTYNVIIFCLNEILTSTFENDVAPDKLVIINQIKYCLERIRGDLTIRRIQRLLGRIEDNYSECRATRYLRAQEQGCKFSKRNSPTDVNGSLCLVLLRIQRN